jgi:hypothetical protein
VGELIPVREDDILELGSRTAAWLAAGAGKPEFMLAGLILRSRPPRPRVSLGQLPDAVP